MIQLSKRRSFTLVELLVVISIIAILASLLVPVISKANEHGRSARCLSNVRQMSLALQLYVDDHKVYPKLSLLPNSIESDLTWRNSLEPYLGTYWTNRSSIFQCPTFELLVAGQTPHGYEHYRGYKGAYGYNGVQTGSLTAAVWTETGGDELPVSEGEVKVPSRMIALGDAFLFEISPKNDPAIDFNGFWELIDFPLKFQLAAQSVRAQKATQQRHFSRYNIGFCDGHAEAIKNERLFADEPEAQRIWYVDNEPHKSPLGQ